jgi:ATP-dependent Clp protease ATP-binding subunit ClpA
VQIVDIQLLRLHRLLGQQGLKLQVTAKAKEFLAARGYDPIYGARPIKRAIQQWVQDPLSLELLQGRYKRGDTVVADVADDGSKLTFWQEMGVATPEAAAA